MKRSPRPAWLALAAAGCVCAVALVASQPEPTRAPGRSPGAPVQAASSPAPPAAVPAPPDRSLGGGVGAASSDRVVRLAMLLDDGPLRGATLRWRREDTREERTCAADDAGLAEVALAPGPWELLADPSWPGPVTFRSTVVEDGDLMGEDWGHLLRAAESPGARLVLQLGEHDLGTTSDGELVRMHWSARAGRLLVLLTPPCWITGRVLAPDCTGVSGARISARLEHAVEEGEPVTSGPGGEFRLRVPEHWVGRHLVCARAPGLGLATDRPREREHDEDESPLPGEPCYPVVLVLAPGLFLEGRVHDERGLALPGARVRADLTPPASEGGVRLEVASDAQGRFRFEGIPAGASAWGGSTPGPRCAAVRLSAELEEHLAWGGWVIARRGGPPVAVQLDRTRLIHGVVRGAGAPLPAATVFALPRPPTDREDPSADTSWVSFDDDLADPAADRARTDDRGRFAVRGSVARGWVVARANGFVPRALEVGPGTELVLELEPARRRVSGRVIHAGSKLPLEHGGVEATTVEEPRLWIASVGIARDGTFAFDALPERCVLSSYGTSLAVDARAGPVRLEVGPPAQPPPGRILVRAVAEESGEPIQPLLELEGRGRWMAGKDDQRIVEGAGRLAFQVGAPGRVPVRYELEVEPGACVDLGVVRLRQGPRLRLDLRWPEGPLQGAEVRWRAPRSGLTGLARFNAPERAPDGPDELPDALPPGEEVEVEILALPWAPERQVPPPRQVLATRVTLLAGETRTLQVDLGGE